MELVAHRGFAHGAPENTVAAVRHAATAGADAVEVDVRAARDGTPVVVHDETVERVTDYAGAVEEYLPAELASMEVLDSGEGIPTLAAVLEAANETGLSVNVELKERAVALAAVDAIRASSLAPDAVWVSSFDPETLRRVADASRERTAPDGPERVDGGTTGIETAYLSQSRREDPVSIAHHLDCAAVHVQYRLTIPGDVVSRAHAAGMDVYAWTLDSEWIARIVAEFGVDGLIADVPLDV